MVMYRGVWLCIGVMVMYGGIWLCMGVYGDVSGCMEMCRGVW